MTGACQSRTLAASGQSHIVQPLSFRRESSKVLPLLPSGRLHISLIFAKLLAPFSRNAVKRGTAVRKLLSFDTKIFIA